MDRDELVAAVERGLSTRELAAHFGFSSSGVVNYWLKKYGLKTKYVSKSEARVVYSREVLEDAVRNSTSMYGVLRHLGIEMTSSSHANITRRVRSLEIDTAHFRRTTGGLRPVNRKSPQDVFGVLPAGSCRARPSVLRRSLLEEGVGEVCALCGQAAVWCGQPLVLQVDHIDGDWRNNQFDNLRLLCPNCHTQQETSKRRVS